MRQQACHYVTVNKAVLCFSPKPISEHVYSEHGSLVQPCWGRVNGVSFVAGLLSREKYLDTEI